MPVDNTKEFNGSDEPFELCWHDHHTHTHTLIDYSLVAVNRRRVVRGTYIQQRALGSVCVCVCVHGLGATRTIIITARARAALHIIDNAGGGGGARFCAKPCDDDVVSTLETTLVELQTHIAR